MKIERFSKKWDFDDPRPTPNNKETALLKINEGIAILAYIKYRNYEEEKGNVLPVFDRETFEKFQEKQYIVSSEEVANAKVKHMCKNSLILEICDEELFIHRNIFNKFLNNEVEYGFVIEKENLAGRWISLPTTSK